jgi:UDP-N-acetylglucosamine/UDP-N-acetylgalactosamine 4-epimerase
MQLLHVEEILNNNRRTWLVTGCAGFIGSHLIAYLLKLGQKVRGIDNLSTGHKKNLEYVKKSVGEDAFANFTFIEDSLTSFESCKNACEGVDKILHQGALGSVPRSIKDPVISHLSNVDGCLYLFEAAKICGVKKIVYASSSSVYGDIEYSPKIEERVGMPLSPYAVTKKVNELYAKVFSELYAMEIVGLRYFNVFGPRQDPSGAYAAVIPRWIGELKKGSQCEIYGDGLTSRDFCYIDNVVQANILAATVGEDGSTIKKSSYAGEVFNIAVGDTTTLKDLYRLIGEGFEANGFFKKGEVPEVIHKDFRQGDIRHSLADISKAKTILGYEPKYSVKKGLEETVKWYLNNEI